MVCISDLAVHRYFSFDGCTEGMTETSTTVAFPQIEQKVCTPGSAGRLVPGIIARVVKPDGSLAGYGEPGQLVVKGPAMALRYMNNEEA